MRLCVLVLVTACGRIAFDAASDASTADTARLRCTTWGPFGAAQHQLAASAPSDDDWVPRIGRDELSLLVDAWNGSNFDVALGRRESPTSPFGRGDVVSGVASAVSDQAGQFSPDESRLYALVGNAATGELRQFARVGSAYVFAFAHPNIAPAVHYWVSDDELRVYWINGNQLTLSTRATVDDPFDTGASIQAFTFANTGMAVALTPDELELVVSLPVASSNDDLDIVHATRADRQSAFAPFIALGLDTARDDVVGSISSDGSTLYMNLDTSIVGGANADIWTATRSCLD